MKRQTVLSFISEVISRSYNINERYATRARDEGREGLWLENNKISADAICASIRDQM